MKRDNSPETVQAAMKIVTHSLGLFTDDGSLKPDGSMTAGTHVRTDESLVVVLHVTPEGAGQLEIMRAEPPPTATSPRLFVITWTSGSPGYLPVFERGDWEDEILKATGPAEIH